MGLDLSFYRVKKEIAEPHIIPPGQGRYAYLGFVKSYPVIDRDEDDVVFNEKVEVAYQRKNHYLLMTLGEIFPLPNQCAYIIVTKLQAHHLLYVMKHNTRCAYDVDEYQRFKSEFEQALKNFDWDENYMFWSWV